jgi:hypothetical protein
MTRLEQFAIGAAIGGTVGLGLSLFVRYVVIPGMFQNLFSQPAPVGPVMTGATTGTPANPQVVQPGV